MLNANFYIILKIIHIFLVFVWLDQVNLRIKKIHKYAVDILFGKLITTKSIKYNKVMFYFNIFNKKDKETTLNYFENFSIM